MGDAQASSILDSIRSVTHLELISKEIEAIPHEKRRPVILAFNGRLHKIVSTDGSHIEYNL